MALDDVQKRLLLQHEQAIEKLKKIEREIPRMKQLAALKFGQVQARKVEERNCRLQLELEELMAKVRDLEAKNSIQQFSIPSDSEKKPSPMNETQVPSEQVSKSPEKESAPKKEDRPKKEPKENKKEKTPKAAKPQPTEETKDVDVSRLDLRVGRILNAKKHPDAESLYLEEIDVGEAKPRTVVSGLVKFVPLEEMQNRMVVVLCNLKPAKMRGVLSEAMVMCASTPEKVEILCPPPGSVPGDRVSCEEYPGEPESLLPPKKKIFEQVAPDLKTDGNCNATYKSSLLKVAGKGVVKTASLTNVQIK